MKLLFVMLGKCIEKIRVPLSSLVEDCEVIFPETTEQSLYPNVRQATVSENYIGIVSINSPAKLFKKDGSYLFDIGRIGRGPGEYSNLNGIQIAEELNRIYLTPLFNAEKILVYDLQGNHKEDIPLVFSPQTKCKVNISGDTVTVFSMPFDKEIPVAYQQTVSGKLIQKLPLIKELISKADFSGEVFSSHSPSNDFQIVAKDTLFHYNTRQNILKPKIVFNYSGERIGSTIRELPLYFFGTAYIEKNQYETEKLSVIVNKESLKTSTYELVNDFFGRLTCDLYTSNQGVFIDSKSAFELIDEIKQILQESKIDKPMKQKLENILNQLHENDNDILFIGKLKTE